jgi:hypothetical protein
MKTPRTTTPPAGESIDFAAGSFTPFVWLHPSLAGGQHEFAALALDVSAGCDQILQMLHVDHMTRSSNEGLRDMQDPTMTAADYDVPLLNLFETERLMRLAMRSLEMLTTAAEASVERVNAAARAEVQS